MTNIKSCYRTARKQHVCNLCNGYIDPGDRYHYEFNKDGSDVWSFLAHLECQFVAQELWEFIDPWDGMFDDEFQDGVRRFCKNMICPKCKNYNMEDEDCMNDESYCIHHCVTLLKEYDFTTVKVDNPKPFGRYWGLVKKEHPLTKLPGEL